MSFNNSTAADRVTCLFQAHGLSGKQLVKCTDVNARAVAKNRVHALKHGATRIRFTHPPAQKRLYSTCASCAFVMTQFWMKMCFFVF